MENLFSMRFCASKPRPTWRFLCIFFNFHEIHKNALASCCNTAGNNRSREELSGGQILVENGSLWQQLWSFKFRGRWAEFCENLKIYGKFKKFREHRKHDGTRALSDKPRVNHVRGTGQLRWTGSSGNDLVVSGPNPRRRGLNTDGRTGASLGDFLEHDSWGSCVGEQCDVVGGQAREVAEHRCADGGAFW